MELLAPRIDAAVDLVFHYDQRQNNDVDVCIVERDGNLKPYVCVRDSSIPGAGKGLYACVSFDAGQAIGVYAGRVMSKIEVDAPGVDRKYLLYRKLFDDDGFPYMDNVVVDGEQPVQPEAEQLRSLGLSSSYRPPFARRQWPGMFAHKMNDASGPTKAPGLSNNCVVVEDCLVIARTRILGSGSFDTVTPLHELLWSYGASYWQHE